MERALDICKSVVMAFGNLESQLPQKLYDLYFFLICSGFLIL